MNDNYNKLVYSDKIFSNEKDKIEHKNLKRIVMKGKRYKAKIREKDNQKIEVLLRNWSYKSWTKDYKDEEEAILLIYSKKHEAKELIYKSH